MSRKGIPALLLLVLSLPVISAERGAVGDLYLAERDARKVFQYDATSGNLSGLFSDFPGDGHTISELVFGGPNHNLFIASHNRAEILEVDGETGGYIRKATVNNPADLAFGPDGNLYVAMDSGVAVYDPETLLLARIVVPTGSNGSVSFGPNGRLWVSKYYPFFQVHEYDAETGTLIRKISDHGALAFGEDGLLYVG